MLLIPDKFNKNAEDVKRLGPQSHTGRMLIEYMCRRIGVEDLGGLSVLDFGCGCRFTDSFVNLRLPIGRYVGVDVDAELIQFFKENLHDPRFQFAHWDVANPLYNPGGAPLASDARLPIPDEKFDVACMFSVITHQLPEDAASIFKILRNYVKPDGRLFFSAAIYAEEGDYKELVPEQVTCFSGYSRRLLDTIVTSAGWNILSFEDKQPDCLPIQASFLCAPSQASSGDGWWRSMLQRFRSAPARRVAAK